MKSLKDIIHQAIANKVNELKKHDKKGGVLLVDDLNERQLGGRKKTKKGKGLFGDDEYQESFITPGLKLKKSGGAKTKKSVVERIETIYDENEYENLHHKKNKYAVDSDEEILDKNAKIEKQIRENKILLDRLKNEVHGEEGEDFQKIYEKVSSKSKKPMKKKKRGDGGEALKAFREKVKKYREKHPNVSYKEAMKIVSEK